MFERCELWQKHVVNGSYPDCDMLPVGKIGKGFLQERNTNFTKAEQITMMTLWCIFGSPLMVGAELTMLDEWTLWLLTRKEIVKLLSNEYMGRQYERSKDYAIWSCVGEKTGERYLAFFNFQNTEQRIACSLDCVEQFAGYNNRALRAKELWSQREIEISEHVLVDNIAAHGAGLFVIEEDFL